MEKNLIEYEVFLEGARVKLKKDSRFYTGGPNDCNPKEVHGIITDAKSDWMKVDWDNGRNNSYESFDLELVERAEVTFVDTNKLYLETEPEDLTDIFNILYPKDKSFRSQQSFYKSETDGTFLLQCQAGRMRSFDDIYIIADTYFPGIDIRIVFKELLLFNVSLNDLKEDYLPKSLGNCSTMRRIRYTNSISSFKQIWNGVDSPKYDSTYTWRDLFNMIYINSLKQLKDWYLKELTAREYPAKPKIVKFNPNKRRIVEEVSVIPKQFKPILK